MNATATLVPPGVTPLASANPFPPNLFHTPSRITAHQREIRNGHSGKVVWLTGLSGAGKSSIAQELERQLFRVGRHTCILDGDNIRMGLGSDLNFSLEDRTENIRRVAEVSKLFSEAGLICITAFISPCRVHRDYVRSILPAGKFVEVFVNAPLEVCEARDVKGLYARARVNRITDFTGISSPYEAPEHPDVEVRTDQLTVAESVARIRDHLEVLDSQMDPII